jgi:hypothetical protein
MGERGEEVRLVGEVLARQRPADTGGGGTVSIGIAWISPDATSATAVSSSASRGSAKARLTCSPRAGHCRAGPCRRLWCGMMRRMRYEFGRLGPQRFEELCRALATRILGPAVQNFGPGPDGGREASFEGRFRLPGALEVLWDGYGILQAKYRTSASSQSDSAWFQEQVRRELDNWTRRLARLGGPRPPEYLILATNVPLSGVAGAGGIDAIDRLLRKRAPAIGVKEWLIWDANQIAALLNGNRDVARAFNEFIMPGDVLAKLNEHVTSIRVRWQWLHRFAASLLVVLLMTLVFALTPWLALDHVTRTPLVANLGYENLVARSIEPLVPAWILASVLAACQAAHARGRTTAWSWILTASACVYLWPATHVLVAIAVSAATWSRLAPRRSRRRRLAAAAVMACLMLPMGIATANWAGPVGDVVSRMAGGRLLDGLERYNFTRSDGAVISAIMINESRGQVTLHFPPEVFDIDDEGEIVGREQCRLRKNPMQLALRDIVNARNSARPVPFCVASHWHRPP